MTMGVEIELWRARIGSFSQPIKCKTLWSVLRVKSVSLCIRILLFLLLAVNGVETNPGPGPNSGNAAEKGRGGSTSGSSRGRGRGEPSESNQRLLRSNSSSAHGGAQRQAFRSASPTVLTYSSTPSAQPPINQWFSSNSGAVSPGPGANPGLFGPSRFQSPSYTHPPQSSFQPGSDISELKQIMIDVQNSVKSMEGRFAQFENSLKEVQETNNKLIESNNQISEDVGNLNKKVAKLESDLKVSEEKRERLEAQSRRENLRIYGLPEEKNETWEDTENKMREYISRDLEMNQANISIERAHRIQGTEKPRPVIVKFSFYKDKESVLKKYKQKRKIVNDLIQEQESARQNADDANEDQEEIDFGLFCKNVTVCEDFPNRVMKARNDLRKFLRSAIANKKNAYLRYDKLVIENEVYEYDSTAEDIVQVDK